MPYILRLPKITNVNKNIIKRRTNTFYVILYQCQSLEYFECFFNTKPSYKKNVNGKIVSNSQILAPENCKGQLNLCVTLVSRTVTNHVEDVF